MDKIGDIHDNYDSVFKDAMVLYKDKSMEFFKMDGAIKITDPLRTESKEIRVSTEFSDLVFGLSNNKGLHLEEETDISRDDLLRFWGYNISLILMSEKKCTFRSDRRLLTRENNE